MFKNAKVGDKVYGFRKGWGEIIHIDKDLRYPIDVLFGVSVLSFGFDGKEIYTDTTPTLFWDEIKFEIPEKPFNLEDELKKLEIKEFNNEEANYYLLWDNKHEQIKYNFINHCQNPLDIYFTDKSLTDFIKNIEDKEITKEQFFTAYKNVFGGI